MANEEKTTPPHTSPFDAIRHESEQYGEYWSGRELYKLLGYSRWEKFKETIERAKIACEDAEQTASDHFHLEVQLIVAGKGAQRKVEDIYLSRYACYLTLQNADPSGKPIVSLAQTYFAVQTRRQELADEEALAHLTEDQRRLFIREQLAQHNLLLAETASHAGVITASDFAIFQDHGYMGLYGGLKARDIHARKGLKPKQKILDHMGYTELAANLFRATQAEEQIQRDNIKEKGQANQTHYRVGRKVRQTIQELGSTMPEDLPTPEKSIQQLRRLEQKRLEQGPQLPLFPVYEALEE